MRFELVVHLSRRDAQTQSEIASALTSIAINTAVAASALASIDEYFKRLNRASTARIVLGKVSEQKE